MQKLSKTRISDTSLQINIGAPMVIDSTMPLDINELKINQGLKSQHKFEGLNFQGSKGDKVTTDFVKTLFDELYE